MTVRKNIVFAAVTVIGFFLVLEVAARLVVPPKEDAAEKNLITTILYHIMIFFQAFKLVSPQCLCLSSPEDDGKDYNYGNRRQPSRHQHYSFPPFRRSQIENDISPKILGIATSAKKTEP